MPVGSWSAIWIVEDVGQTPDREMVNEHPAERVSSAPPPPHRDPPLFLLSSSSFPPFFSSFSAATTTKKGQAMPAIPTASSSVAVELKPFIFYSAPSNFRNQKTAASSLDKNMLR
jgi:hypothetical protein